MKKHLIILLGLTAFLVAQDPSDTLLFRDKATPADIEAGEPNKWIDSEQLKDSTAKTHVFGGLMVDYAPAWEGSVDAGNGVGSRVAIETGVDLSEIDRLIVSFRRTDSTRPWPTTKIVNLSQFAFDEEEGEMLSHFNDDFLSLTIDSDDIANGAINAHYGGGVAMTVTKIQFKKRAVGVSRQLGRIVPVSSLVFNDDDDAISQGHLPLKPATHTGLAAANPLWAAAHPWWVVGDDIVLGSEVEGIVIRNTGGLAAGEGAFQGHAQARSPNNPIGTSVNSGGGATVRSVDTSAGETRMDNIAIQHYSLLDNYVEIVSQSVGADGEDRLVLIGSGQGLNEPTILGSSIAEVIAEYESLEFYFADNSSGTTGRTASASVSAAQLQLALDDELASLQIPWAGARTPTLREVGLSTITVGTATFQLINAVPEGWDVTQWRYLVYGVKRQKTVLNPDIVEVTNPSDVGVLTSNEDGTSSFKEPLFQFFQPTTVDLNVPTTDFVPSGEMAFDVEAGKTYRFKFTAICWLHGTPDIRFRIDVPDGAATTGAIAAYHTENAVAKNVAFGTSTGNFASVATTSALNADPIVFDGWIAPATSGTVQFQIARNTAGTASQTTTLLSGSWVEAREIPLN